MAIDSVNISSLITRFVGSSSQTLTGSRLLHPQRLVLWSGEGITVIIIVTSKCQHHENGVAQNTLQNRRYILDSRSMILADSLNCMEWWVKVSVRPCTNRDNIQFQLHQTMSVTRLERYQIVTINCGAPSQADFNLNYFLSKFLNFPQISTKLLSNSPLPPTPASRLAQLMVLPMACIISLSVGNLRRNCILQSQLLFTMKKNQSNF